VRRYGAADPVDALGDDLVLVGGRRDVHVTPKGVEQPLTWVLAQRGTPSRSEESAR